MFFIDALNGIAVGEEGLICQTINGGSIWTTRRSGTRNYLYSAVYSDINNGVAVGANGTITITTNAAGNDAWTPKSSRPIKELFGIFFTDLNTGTAVGEEGLAVGEFGTILKTTNGGTNWRSQTSGTGTSLYSVSFIDSNNATVVGLNGIILKTTNGGTTWAPQSGTTKNTLNSVSFINGNVGMAVGDNGTIIKTTNGGLLLQGKKLIMCQIIFHYHRITQIHFTLQQKLVGSRQ